MNNQIYSLGIIGVRGYVGKELLGLISNHPNIKTDWLSSRQLNGQKANSVFGKTNSDSQSDFDFIIESLSPEQVADKNTDIIVLALPNGLAVPFVEAIEASSKAKIIIDLSADYRFEEPDAPNPWIYSVPELDHLALENAAGKLIKISNPGCYATAMQLALAPVMELLSGPAHCFGVSGYSGAGTKPSPNNDPENLKDNLIGYKLVEHLHEKEVSVRLKNQVSFSPHVAAFFRGINMTIQVDFKSAQSSDSLFHLYNDYYSQHPLVNCQQEVPVIKNVINTAGCLIGGFTVSSDGKRGTIVSCLDNLMKGAASQALQNINIALGLEPLLSVEKKH